MAYTLAENLHKTLSEIMAIPTDEFIGWLAYYKLKSKQESGNYQKDRSIMTWDEAKTSWSE